MKERIKKLENRIAKIQDELSKIHQMRPGHLSRQFKDRKKKRGPFWQLNYTFKMRTHTEYVKAEFLGQVRAQIQNYRKFKRLTEDWIELMIQLSKLNIELAKLGRK